MTGTAGPARLYRNDAPKSGRWLKVRAMEPDLILYDEPTSELDPTMAATISEIIACLKEEIHVTSIVVSHDRDLSLTIADRVGIIMDGEIQAIGTPEEIKENNDPVITEFLNPKIDLNNPRYKTLE